MSNEKEYLSNIAETTYFTEKDVQFINCDGFVTMKKDGGEEQRVLLHRLFPYDEKDAYISVLDTESNELGMILSLNDFEGESRSALEAELARKYYVRKIIGVASVKDRHGFTYWTVRTEDGEAEFTLHDTYKSIYRIGNDRLIITDVDGNRYSIESVAALDGASYKRIELYL